MNIDTHSDCFRILFVLALLFTLTILTISGGGGGGSGGDGSDDNSNEAITIQNSDIIDIWRIYYSQNDRAVQETESYLTFSLVDEGTSSCQ